MKYCPHHLKAVTNSGNKVPRDSIAIATSGFYLCSNLGTLLGVSIGSSIQRGILKFSAAPASTDPQKTQGKPTLVYL
jgi:hypothetical protein